mgnify:CR=1 FL=1
MKRGLALALLIAAAFPALAQSRADGCGRAVTVHGFKRWGHPTGTTLMAGRAATLALRPVADVHFSPALARKPKPATFGGFFPLTIRRAGRYEIGLSEPAWIDLVQRGDRLESATHRHGPACSGIAKIVGFDLRPGRYWMQLSEAKDRRVSVMIAAKPIAVPGGGTAAGRAASYRRSDAPGSTRRDR